MADIFGEVTELAPPASRSSDAQVIGPARAGLKALLQRMPNRGDVILAATFFGCALIALAGIVAGVLVDEAVLSAGWRMWLGRSGMGDEGSALGLALLFGALGGRRIRPNPARLPPRCENELEKAVALLASQPSASAGLVRLGDKSVVFSDCSGAFIMYARQGRSLVALFDPVGDRKAWPGLVLKFIEMARRHGCRPVFYQVSPDFLPIAVECGMRPLKLGEQAVLDLQGFDTKGGDWVKLRRSINRAERDGLQFEMVPVSGVAEIMEELASVSQEWLAQHNAGEKGFSLGTFKPEYVAAEPVAVIRFEGRIVAFASILTMASGGDAFIDLMRHIPGVHRGMMDLLFVRIIERLKADGYRTLNLGMAPLAGLASHRRAPLWNRIGRRVFERGERFYNFQGVLAFKSKFDPDWQPRYLAVSGGGLPLAALLDVTTLIGGGLKGVLRR